MKKGILAATTIVAALVLAGCSAGAGESGEATEEATGAPEQSAVTVGIIPIQDFAMAFVAQEEGFFEEEGLTVTFQPQPSAKEIVPGVVNATKPDGLQFGTAAVSPILQAVANGLPLQIVSSAASVPEAEEDDISGLVVAPDSGITNPKDLNGKVIAVNAIGAASELTARETVEKAGGDASTLTFVAMPFPEMVGALQRGDIAAAWLIEPFVTGATKAGMVNIGYPLYEGFYPGGTHAVYFSSKQFVAENPNTVAAFDRAIQKATALALEDDAVVRAALQKYANMPPEVAESIRLSAFSGEVSTDALNHIIKLMERTNDSTGAPFLKKGAVSVEDVYQK